MFWSSYQCWFVSTPSLQARMLRKANHSLASSTNGTPNELLRIWRMANWFMEVGISGFSTANTKIIIIKIIIMIKIIRTVELNIWHFVFNFLFDRQSRHRKQVCGSCHSQKRQTRFQSTKWFIINQIMRCWLLRFVMWGWISMRLVRTQQSQFIQDLRFILS